MAQFKICNLCDTTNAKGVRKCRGCSERPVFRLPNADEIADFARRAEERAARFEWLIGKMNEEALAHGAEA